MNIAVIGGIEGNLTALTAVLIDSESFKVSKIVCVGDAIGRFTRSLECLRLLRSLGAIFIKGISESLCCGELSEFGISHSQYRAATVATRAKIIEAGELENIRNWPASYELENLLFLSTLRSVVHLTPDTLFTTIDLFLKPDRAVVSNSTDGFLFYSYNNCTTRPEGSEIWIRDVIGGLLGIGDVGVNRFGSGGPARYAIINKDSELINLRSVNYDRTEEINLIDQFQDARYSRYLRERL